jgi:cobalamin biosynthesis Mg chelatase CobN
VSAFANAGETVYETEIPSVTSEPSNGGTEKAPTHHSANTGKSESDQAHGSTAETGGAGAGESESEAGSSEGGHKKKHHSSQEEEGNTSTGAGGGGGNGNKPNGGGQEGSIAEGKEVGSKPVAHTSSAGSGGSSPVVPILIAVVVLAAISIGVVLYRQRKSGQDGSDGRVSSSNAS